MGHCYQPLQAMGFEYHDGHYACLHYFHSMVIKDELGQDLKP